MDTETTLGMVGDRLLGKGERRRTWQGKRVLAEQVLAMHERDHRGSARFCEQAEACRTADAIAR